MSAAASGITPEGYHGVFSLRLCAFAGEHSFEFSMYKNKRNSPAKAQKRKEMPQRFPPVRVKYFD
jgi:hypothetical protein